jgi:hypothetical protein
MIIITGITGNPEKDNRITYKVGKESDEAVNK